MKKIKLFDGHSWRFSGILTQNYNWVSKDWIDYFSGSSKRIDICYCCDKKFNDNEILYAGFFDSDKGYGKEIQFICKCCAYKISDKVTDYKLDEDGNPEPYDVVINK